MKQPLHVAIVLFDGFTALDAVGPYEVFASTPGIHVDFAAMQPGPVLADSRRLALMASRRLSEIERTDLLLAPGGPGDEMATEDPELLAELRRLAAKAKLIASVCTGSLILGAAGLLAGRRATSHWMRLDRLRRYGALPTQGRFVEDGYIVTSAGVSAGIDMALRIVGRLKGSSVAEAVQLGIEYAPQPPYAAGTPESAPLLTRLAVEACFERELRRRMRRRPPSALADTCAEHAR